MVACAGGGDGPGDATSSDFDLQGHQSRHDGDTLGAEGVVGFCFLAGEFGDGEGDVVGLLYDDGAFVGAAANDLALDVVGEFVVKRP